MGPATAGEASTSAVEGIVLECGGGSPPLRLAPGSGKICCIDARSEAACARLAREALECSAVEVVPRAGGLISNLSVLENILLPAIYHGHVTGAQLAGLVYRAFEHCGFSQDEVDALCARSVADLDGYERRLVALVRSLLMHPPILLLERVFEGLTAVDVERVARFGEYYRRAVAGGTLVYVNLAGMPRPELAADVRVEAE